MKAAFLGMGRRSLGFMKRFREAEGVTVTAGADRWDAARDNAGKIIPGLAVWESPEELFAHHRDIDLALVFSRDCDHEAFAEIAFKNDCDVFTEKPMATSPEACRRMIQSADRAGKRLMVGFNLRFNPTVIEAKRFLDTGRLGKINAVWEWHEVDLNYFHNWMSVRANSGGLLYQKGSHDFDLFNWFTQSHPVKVAGFGGLDRYGGEEPNSLHCPECENRENCPERVRKGALTFPPGDPKGVPNLEQTKCAFREEIDVCDNHVLSILFDNGIKGAYAEIHGSPVSQRRFLISGKNGRLEFELHDKWLRWTPRDRSSESTRWEPPETEGGHGGADPPLTKAILSAFRDGAPIPVTAEDGLNAVLLSWAGEEAIRTRKVVDITRTAHE